MKRLSLKNYPWHNKLIAPHDGTPDEQRREIILNILLVGIIPISLLADLATISNHLSNETQVANSLIMVVGFTGTLVLFLWLSRRGFYKQISYVFLGFVVLAALNMLLGWGFTLPATQMTFIIALVLAGVLLPAITALWLTFGLAICVLVISYLQVNGHAQPDLSWMKEHVKFGDSFGFAAGLLIIGLVSWLANREIDLSLKRARHSEAVLELERDQLEVKVVERTRELERAQLERVMELQRLAEFGRLSAGLLHDVASPLTVASLNLKELGGKSEDILVRQAVQSLHYIERFLDSARKQLKAQSIDGDFMVAAEIKQIITILKHRAREAAVSVDLKPSPRIKMFADPVKFSQIVANLILNAIEAYDHNSDESLRKIVIDTKQEGKWIVISVTDHGRGLSKDQMGRIFDTFYSTQDTNGANMGIGLATVKRLVEHDFNGRVKVASTPKAGTVFTVYLKNSPESTK